MYELIVSDMDGTLVKNQSFWWDLHDYFGVSEKARKNLEAYTNGLISYEEFMRRDISLWGNPHISKLEKAIQHELAPHVKQVFEELNKKYKTAIITCGIGFIARKVAKELGIEIILSNDVEIDENGYITGREICNVNLLEKHKSLIELSKRLNIPLERIVAIGDTIYDKSFLTTAGLGVVYGPDKELRKLIDNKNIVGISDWREILEII
ncbi:MAG: HAD family hydrolase [Candidatus Aenigmatarchaeota archaeon]